jgi:hypothetical protein
MRSASDFGPRDPSARPSAIRESHAARAALARVAAVLLLVFAWSCQPKGAGREAAPQPIGGAETFRSMLDEAMRRADPQGAVLVVLWTTDQPPPSALEETARHWNRYGLIPVGVCLDLVEGAVPESMDGSTPAGPPGKAREGRAEGIPRERAIDRLRKWEKSHRGVIRGLFYDGEPAVFSTRLGLLGALPSVTLLSAQGAVLWSSEGFGRLPELEAVLNVHLGQPSVA